MPKQLPGRRANQLQEQPRVVMGRRIPALAIALLLAASPIRAGDLGAPTSGIAASRAQIRTAFESRFGLQFSPVPLRDGRPRLLAEDKRQLRMVEIIGSEERVSSASVTVFSTTISAALMRPGSLLATLLEVAAPQWKSGSRWVVGYLTKADDYIEGTTQHDKLQVNIKVARPFGMITLTVESR